MRYNQTNFVQRFFNSDLKNGMIAAGFISLANMPESVSFHVNPWYSCSIILSASPSSGLSSFRAGDVIQAFPGSSNTAAGNLLHLAESGTDIFIFHICFGENTYEALKRADLLLPNALFHVPLMPHMDSWMPTLVKELKNTPQENLPEVYLDIQKFIIHLHRPLLSTTDANSRMVASAKQLLYDARTENISLPEVAESLGYSYENFRKLFKAETGLSPLQFLLDSRMHYAQRLLTEGMSVKETAALVGYADPYVFSKQFKKLIGQSPSAYKH